MCIRDSPNWVKYGVPFVLVTNVIMFATANFGSVGCTVQLTISIAGDTTVPIPILPFTLAGSVNDMWNAGVYPLAIIIALASGGWPYAKLLLLAFGWFAPATIIKQERRIHLLELLDVLGKWSLIDVYVLVMLMVAFHFFLSSSMIEKLSLIPADALTVSVVVLPDWGIFGFLFGAMGSLLVNHVMTFWVRKAQRSDEDLQDAILGQLVRDLRTPRIALSLHRFNILDAEGRPYRYSAGVRILYVATFALLFVLVLVGSVLPSLRFSFYGVAGLAFGFIDPNLSSTVYSATSIATSISKSAQPTVASVLSVVFLQIIYLAFALITPLMLTVAFIVIWVVPLTLSEQITLSFVVEILWAWQALLVLTFSMLAAVLQISQLAQFIVNHATGSLCDLAKAPLSRVFPNPQDAQCFMVIATLESSCGVIFAASLALELFSSVAWRLLHPALQDRELAMRRHPPVSPGDMTGLTGFIVRRSLEAFGPSLGQVGNAGGGAGDVMNMYAQAQGAFDDKSQYTGYGAPAPYGGGMPGASYGSAGGMSPYVSPEAAAGNPILAREALDSQMSAANPMFSSSSGAPGGSLTKAGNRASIDV